MPSVTWFKRCTGCGCTKPATAQFFHLDKSRRDGFLFRCKVCYGLYAAANKERLKVYRRRKYNRNKARYQAMTRAWEAANKERVTQMAVARVRNRAALLEQAEGTHTHRDIQDMLISQEGRCAYCEVVLNDKYHVEHMTPISRGGRNDWKNLAVTCPTCNRRKGVRTLEEFIGFLEDA